MRQGHPVFSAAPGWYFSLRAKAELSITDLIIYWWPSLGHEAPVLRLRDLLQRYEARTYAIHRPDFMPQMRQDVQPLRSLLARDLLAGVFRLVSGKAARLPHFYYGRSIGAWVLYESWRPVKLLVTSSELF